MFLWPFLTKVFTSIQEKAIEAEMVATKDVSMEPTIRSLQDDLVGEQINNQNINEKNAKELLFRASCVIICVSPSLFLILKYLYIHHLASQPIIWKISGRLSKEKKWHICSVLR